MKCDDLAIVEELIGEGIANAVSPGFLYGRTGNAGAGDWLKNNEVFSNRVGIPFGLANGVVLKVWVGNQNVSTFDVSVYEHDGDAIGLTLLTTVSIVAARNAFFDVTDFGVVNVTQFKQLACRVTSGTSKEPKVALFLGGTS